MRRSSFEQLHQAADGFTRLLRTRKSVHHGPIHSSQKRHNHSSVCTASDSATLFCSAVNIQTALGQLREDRTTSKLHLEDLLISKDEQKVFAVVDFLIETTTSMLVVPENEALEQTVVRPWTRISFTDNICNAKRYVEYGAEMKRFVKTLKRQRRIYHRTQLDLPLSFRVRVHLRPPMDVFSIIRLFHEIIRDPTVQEVEFPQFLQESFFAEPDEAARMFASFIDNSTLRWSGPAIALHISYKDDSAKRKHLNHEEPRGIRLKAQQKFGRKDQAVRGRSKYNSATVGLLRECAISLEKLTLDHFQMTCEGGSLANFSLLSSTSSRHASIDYDN